MRPSAPPVLQCCLTVRLRNPQVDCLKQVSVHRSDAVELLPRGWFPLSPPRVHIGLLADLTSRRTSACTTYASPAAINAASEVLSPRVTSLASCQRPPSPRVREPRSLPPPSLCWNPSAQVSLARQEARGTVCREQHCGRTGQPAMWPALAGRAHGPSPKSPVQNSPQAAGARGAAARQHLPAGEARAPETQHACRIGYICLGVMCSRCGTWSMHCCR